MKIIGWVLVFCITLGSQVVAMSPVNPDMIVAAQEYGKKNAAQRDADFDMPWSANEETASSKDLSAEHAIVYTPFFLVAANARTEKVSHGKSVSAKDSAKVLDSYSGYLVFAVTLSSKKPLTAANVSAVIVQNKQFVTIDPNLCTIEPSKASAANSSHHIQCYVYVKNKDLLTGKPLMLHMKVKGQNERRFYFNLPKIQ